MVTNMVNSNMGGKTDKDKGIQIGFYLGSYSEIKKEQEESKDTVSQSIDGKEMLSVHQAKELLGISRWSVYKWIDRGWLEAVKLRNGTFRISKDSVMKALEGEKTSEDGKHVLA